MFAGGCRAVLAQTPAGWAWDPSVRCGEGGRGHRGPELPVLLQGRDLLGWKGALYPNVIRGTTDQACGAACDVWFEIEQVDIEVIHDLRVINYFFLHPEAFLWATWEEDGFPGVSPRWRVDERFEGFSERLHGKCFWRWFCPRWSFCHRTRTAGKKIDIIKKKKTRFHLPPSPAEMIYSLPGNTAGTQRDRVWR